MISGRDFLVLSDEWAGSPTSAIHLTQRLLRDNRVFWFNMINRIPLLRRAHLTKVGRIVRQWLGRRLHSDDRRNGHADGPGRPHTVTPVMIPWFKPVVRRINQISLRRQYDGLRRLYQIGDPILITTWPSAVDFVKSVPAAAKLYYCPDDWLHYPGLNAADWRIMEQELIAAVDGVVVTSRHLAKKVAGSLPVLYLPHGVDFDHFHKAAESTVVVPQMERLRRPIVGFFGQIASWVDFQVVAALGASFPEVSFALIGDIDPAVGQVPTGNNLHYLGAVPYAELPRFARYFNVALIPFVTNDLTKAVNPLKLLEYYALGLPVLATRLPELESVGGPIWLASTPREFCDALARILPQDRRDWAVEAKGIARQNTWDQRVAQLCTFIEDIGHGPVCTVRRAKEA